MKTRWYPALVLCAATFVVSCGDASMRPWPTTGTVQFSKGKPVTFGIIEFAPENGRPAARGTINADGTFTLKTGERDGAIAGKHRIAVIQLFARDGVDPKARHHVHTSRLVHARHARFDTSGLEQVVEPNRNNEFIIEVEPGD